MRILFILFTTFFVSISLTAQMDNGSLTYRVAERITPPATPALLAEDDLQFRPHEIVTLVNPEAYTSTTYLVSTRTEQFNVNNEKLPVRVRETVSEVFVHVDKRTRIITRLVDGETVESAAPVYDWKLGEEVSNTATGEKLRLRARYAYASNARGEKLTAVYLNGWSKMIAGPAEYYGTPGPIFSLQIEHKDGTVTIYQAKEVKASNKQLALTRPTEASN